MKKLVSLLVLISSFTFSAPLPAQASSEKSAVVAAPAMVTWDSVQNYIKAHAVVSDSITLDHLRYEASVGLRTWTLSTQAEANSNLFDGPGLGWPALGQVILFGSYDEAVTAANMISAATKANNVTS